MSKIEKASYKKQKEASNKVNKHTNNLYFTLLYSTKIYVF